MRACLALLLAAIATPAAASPAAEAAAAEARRQMNAHRYWFLSPRGIQLMERHDEELRRLMKEVSPKLREDAKAARAEVAAALGATPFDPLRMDRALREQQAGYVELQRRTLTLQLDLYRALPAEDRRRLADQMRDPSLFRRPRPGA